MVWRTSQKYFSFKKLFIDYKEIFTRNMDRNKRSTWGTRDLDAWQNFDNQVREVQEHARHEVREARDQVKYKPSRAQDTQGTWACTTRNLADSL